MKKLKYIILLVFVFNKAFGQTDISNKIELYGRVWGMIKYYHPTIQKNKINWDTVFVQNYNKVLNANDAIVYNDLIKKLLDTVGIVKTNIKPYKFYPKDTTVCNLDFNWLKTNKVLNASNKELLLNIIKYYKPRKSKVIQKESIGYDMKEVWETQLDHFPNEANCMLAFFTYWNRINYFFAYKDLMDTPWDETLKEFIPRVRQASGKRDFYLLIAELVTRINDGHGWRVNREVYSELGSNLYFGVNYVDNKTIVSNINDSLSKFLGINQGDEIIESNGQLISQRRIELDKYIGGSNVNSIDLIKNNRILGLKYHGVFTLKIKDTLGVIRTISFNRDSTFNSKLYYYAKPKVDTKPYHFISDKYGYINAGKTTNKDVRKAFRNFSSTKAIIIDLREYGGTPAYFYSMHLTNKNIPYAKLYVNNEKFPGTFSKMVYKTNSLGVAVFKKKYKGKIVLLTDASTGSSMELMSMWLRAIENVIIIGRNTGGYDGSCKPFLVGPGFGAAYSGDAVFYPDGKQTQRIGIEPDIYVEKTYDGVKRGKDEILERAIDYLDSK